MSEQKEPEANELQKLDDRAAEEFAASAKRYEALCGDIARAALEAVRRVK